VGFQAQSTGSRADRPWLLRAEERQRLQATAPTMRTAASRMTRAVLAGFACRVSLSRYRSDVPAYSWSAVDVKEHQ